MFDVVVFFAKSFFLLWICTLLVQWLCRYMMNLKTYWNLKSWPILPIIGNLHQFKNNGADMLDKVYKMSMDFTDQPIFCFWRGWVPIVVFHRAEALDIVYSGIQNTQKAFDYDFLIPWLKEGLLTSHGDKWLRRRKLLTPSFHFEILNDFIDIINENAQTLVQKLEKFSAEEKDVDLFPLIGLCSLDIIAETAMGININAQNKSDSKYIKAVKRMSELLQNRTCNPFHWNDFLFKLTKAGREHDRCLKILLSFTRAIIMKRDKEFEASDLGTQKRIAFLDMLLRAKHTDNSLSFDDIQEEVDTFMFEGHDTTAAAIAWACQLIGSHPEVQQKVHKELDEVFGDSDRFVDNQDLGGLKYLEGAIKESLRLFPSVAFHGRVMSEDAEINGQIITKGTTLYVFVYGIHRDPKYFPEPEKFDPDRFMSENQRDRHAHAYVPFAAGRRNCIGQRFAMMEMKIVLANLFRRFQMKSLKTIEQIQPTSDAILKPLNGIPVSVKLRLRK